MNSREFTQSKHGKTRTRNIKVGDGKTYTKHEKFCTSHGWIDVFAVGGDFPWQTYHGKCVPMAEFESIKKAA